MDVMSWQLHYQCEHSVSARDTCFC